MIHGRENYIGQALCICLVEELSLFLLQDVDAGLWWWKRGVEPRIEKQSSD